MVSYLRTFCPLVTALLLGGMGIAGLIDQATMITLVIVLVICMPSGRAACFGSRRA